MSFNEKKCKSMFFDKRRHNLLNTAFVEDLPGLHFSLKMTDRLGNIHHLEESSTERDLGILINDRLSWKAQIAKSTATAYSALNQLKRAFHYWTVDSFRLCSTVLTFAHILNIAQQLGVRTQPKTSRRLKKSRTEQHY